MLGGYGIFGAGASVTRTYSSLPVHNMIKLKIQLFKIDSWNNESAFISIDGTVVWTKSYGVTEGF
jgi:hypothetical protein